MECGAGPGVLRVLSRLLSCVRGCVSGVCVWGGGRVFGLCYPGSLGLVGSGVCR